MRRHLSMCACRACMRSPYKASAARFTSGGSATSCRRARTNAGAADTSAASTRERQALLAPFGSKRARPIRTLASRRRRCPSQRRATSRPLPVYDNPISSHHTTTPTIEQTLAVCTPHSNHARCRLEGSPDDPLKTGFSRPVNCDIGQICCLAYSSCFQAHELGACNRMRACACGECNPQPWVEAYIPTHTCNTHTNS